MEEPPSAPGEVAAGWRTDGDLLWTQVSGASPWPIPGAARQDTALEVLGVGPGSLTQEIPAAAVAGEARCLVTGAGFELLPDERLRAVDVVVSGFLPATGAPATLTSRIGPEAWTAGAWNRIEIPARSMGLALDAGGAGPAAALCATSLRLTLDAGPALGPLDRAVARLDNVLLHVVDAAGASRGAGAAIGVLGRIVFVSRSGPTPDLPPVIAGPTLLRILAADPSVGETAAGLGCVVLEATVGSQALATWSTCDGTLTDAGGEYHATWSAPVLAGCTATLTLRAEDALGHLRFAHQRVRLADAAACVEEAL